MTISSSLSFDQTLNQKNSNNKKSSISLDSNLSGVVSQTIKQTPPVPKEQPISSIDMIEQYAYAPNISAMFNAYLEKQKLNSGLDSKKEEVISRLTANGMDKRSAQSYAQTSVNVYKQILEAQLNSKINEQVKQQEEFKQKTSSSQSANPYVQMTGTLVNLYS